MSAEVGRTALHRLNGLGLGFGSSPGVPGLQVDSGESLRLWRLKPRAQDRGVEPQQWEAQACGRPGGGSTGALKARPPRWKERPEPVREAEWCSEVPSPLADTAPAALLSRPCCQLL